MSKAEILAELPKLPLEERREIFERICEIEELDLLGGSGPSSEEKAVLDSELEEFKKNSETGSSWTEVDSRLRKSPRP